MNTDVMLAAATTSSNPLSPNGSEVGTMMSCETCDLVGGPFPAAEAAHLRAIHDRLHHGMLFAA
ncbi:hypothetical protein KIH74_01470 [Kineosporia sp. J2-2]|uniref:Uncharacterized protein n=1 Tax=Kineosporia corallincola TaxID=2835133 RepID=A0ABS5T9P6_9ACTN|nr:hypothetical protein [Kineosporia corallincola]MBT0767573.1 hypothetical protein [Kineosporia corallincola]